MGRPRKVAGTFYLSSLGADSEAAEAVNDEQGSSRPKGPLTTEPPPTPFLDVLQSLVSNSLLLQVAAEGEPRFTMLETIGNTPCAALSSLEKNTGSTRPR